MRHPVATLLLCLAMLIGLAYVPSCGPLAPGATTQPGQLNIGDVGQMVTLAITDYDAFVAAGIVPETPALDAAVKAYFSAQKAYAAGEGSVKAINDAGLNFALAMTQAKQLKK